MKTAKAHKVVANTLSSYTCLLLQVNVEGLNWIKLGEKDNLLSLACNLNQHVSRPSKQIAPGTSKMLV